MIYNKLIQPFQFFRKLKIKEYISMTEIYTSITLFVLLLLGIFFINKAPNSINVIIINILIIFFISICGYIEMKIRIKKYKVYKL